MGIFQQLSEDQQEQASFSIADKDEQQIMRLVGTTTPLLGGAVIHRQQSGEMRGES